MEYDHHWTAPEKKIKMAPQTESEKLLRVRSINVRKVLIRKMKILKFHAKANARSTSKIK